MSDPKFFVTLAKSVMWLIFMIIDVSLLIPSIVLRYTVRVSSQCVLVSGRYQGRPQKTLVIVGGNFAGLTALREVQNSPLFRVVLIDQRQFFEYTPGVLRLFCQPDGIRTLVHPLPHGSHHILHGKVTQIYDSHLLYMDAATQKSNSLHFDYLILATGSTYTYPITPSAAEATIAARAQGWKAASKRVDEATRILILGGGAVGTELAAEIVDFYGLDKRVVLVDASPKLVPMFARQVSDHAENWLKSKGVQLLLDHKLEKWDAQSCTLQNGQVLKADLVFVCFGDRPNSGPLVVTNDALTSNVQLDGRQCVKVDDFLRVEGRRNVFCCGDVAAPPTEGVKQAFHAEVQGHVAGENVTRLATGRPFLRYPQDAAWGSDGMPMVYVLSLGKWDGVIGFNSWCLHGPLAAVLKWVVEWTKIRQMLGRPVGVLVWMIGDSFTFFLSRTLLPPVQAKQA